MELQFDYAFKIVREKRRTLRITIDAGTAFTEGCIISSREADAASGILDPRWILKHGAPTAIPADDKFNQKSSKALFATRNILFELTSTRRHEETGLMERNIRAIKIIVKKLDKEV